MSSDVRRAARHPHPVATGSLPAVSVSRVTTVPSADPADRLPVPPLFDHLVDDTSLLAPRGEVPEVAAVVTRYLATREGRHGGLLGQLVCPVSRLPALVKELARSGPARPVDVSLVVDTGLGAVPKALSTVFSRSNLLTPRTIETAAPVSPSTFVAPPLFTCSRIFSTMWYFVSRKPNLPLPCVRSVM